jgi:Protein of unknown function (DUF3309)
MSLGLILVILLIIFLIGGFSGRFGGYGYGFGHGRVGLVGTILIPPLAPKLSDNVTVYIVLNDFGNLGRGYVETDEAEVDEWTVVRKIMDGEYSNPARVVAFNIAEGWSRDVTEDIAQAVAERGRSENHW